MDVPGIGMITGLRCSSHATAIWLGVAPCALAIASSAEPSRVNSPAASGNQGMKPMPWASQYFSTSSLPRSAKL